MSRNNLWTTAELLKLQKLIAANKNPKLISEEFDRSFNAVRQKIAELKAGKSIGGHGPNLPEIIFERLKEEPIKVLELAREFNLTTRQVENVIFDLSKSK